MNQEQAFNKQVTVTNPDWLIALLGISDKYVRLIENHFAVSIASRGEVITIMGNDEDEVEKVRQVLLSLLQLLEHHITPRSMDVITAVKMAKNGTLDYFINLYEEVIGRAADGTAIRAKNFGQLQYVKAIHQHDVVFGMGPAGTGKTFLAVVMAVQAMREGQVKKVILTRPAVEAGENLGFLPGDLKEKVDPYLRPIYDALYTVYGTEQTNRLMERGVIEIAPLAYMRGRTLDDAFVILDEAQNTTIAQMKMFLTRLGFGSKMIINGDQTQIDLPKGVKSGLIDAEHKLKGTKRIEFVKFDEFDVVRHPVVADIIRAYSREN
ncbi:PhoH family protein [Facklamia sp. DSM 111018]|uniref:PhoH-like protein n=1 Tax=Facklamia lactis TaxID=2749967 RepID=A0ABS0LRC2_9LACT|nr:PhoH family protein [Facklamia lactis]MBG9980104.1 PhoH family protein [Facklamia lactis]MBG9985906.1 PhoH family protein [Facklamia lactis]